jgi:Domain of Unknown Function (DUF1206)
MATRDRLRELGDDTREAVWNPATKAKREAKQEARQGRGWYAALARIGLVAKGASFLLVGVLAMKLALGNGGKATSRQGALETLAEHSFGKVLLVLLALGFGSYALWRLVQAFAERADPSDGEAEGAAKKWGKRAGYIGRGVIYASLTYTSIKILTGAGSQSQNQEAHKRTGEILSWPAGRWIVGAAGVVILGAGLWNVYRGLTQRFEKRWRARGGASVKKWGARIGVVGHLARGLVFGLIGVFVIKAAVDYNPKDAIGLDGALQKLVNAPYGPWVLGTTAAGLVAYGVFCLFDARYRDVSANA